MIRDINIKDKGPACPESTIYYLFFSSPNSFASSFCPVMCCGTLLLSSFTSCNVCNVVRTKA